MCGVPQCAFVYESPYLINRTGTVRLKYWTFRLFTHFNYDVTQAIKKSNAADMVSLLELVDFTFRRLFRFPEMLKRLSERDHFFIEVCCLHIQILIGSRARDFYNWLLPDAIKIFRDLHRVGFATGSLR